MHYSLFTTRHPLSPVHYSRSTTHYPRFITHCSLKGAARAGRRAVHGALGPGPGRGPAAPAGLRCEGPQPTIIIIIISISSSSSSRSSSSSSSSSSMVRGLPPTKMVSQSGGIICLTPLVLHTCSSKVASTVAYIICIQGPQPAAEDRARLLGGRLLQGPGQPGGLPARGRRELLHRLPRPRGGGKRAARRRAGAPGGLRPPGVFGPEHMIWYGMMCCIKM